MVNEVASSALVCFTDGSCLTNPGPCGAGAVIYHPEGHFDTIKRPVASHGSILLGELVAILSVMEHILTNSHQIDREEIRIFCDSQTAVRILTLNWTKTKVDFARAFDKVPHRRLLHKLEYYGIRGSTHKWTNSWLSGRTQQVVLNGQPSDPVPVLSGVPQGSV